MKNPKYLYVAGVISSMRTGTVRRINLETLAVEIYVSGKWQTALMTLNRLLERMAEPNADKVITEDEANKKLNNL